MIANVLFILGFLGYLLSCVQRHQPVPWWDGIGLALFVVLFIILSYKAFDQACEERDKEREERQQDLQKRLDAKPHIRFKGFSVVRALIEVNGSTLTSGQPIVEVFPKFKDGDYFAGTREKNPEQIHTLLPRFYRILFANDPDKGQPANKALDVRAEIKFYDATSKQPIFTEIEGRWSDTERPGTEGFKPISSNRVVMPPNGQPFLLDIIMKYDEDEECYAHNNESPHRTAGDFRDRERVLVAGEYDVEVWIRGSNVDESFWFHLVNQGKDKQVELTLTPDSQ